MSNVLACVLYALGCFGYLAYLVNRSRVMIRVAYVNCFVSAIDSLLICPLQLHLTTSELWSGQEQEGILP